MSKINSGRVLLGGIVAGIVMNVVDFIVNVPILGAQWKVSTDKLLPNPPPGLDGTSAMGWILSDLVAGLFMIWLYAAIRPRFGPGPKTALMAGLGVWFITHLAYASLFFMGLYPAELVCASTAGALVAFLAGGLAGGALYQEA